MNSTGLTKKGCRCVPYTSLKSGSSVLRGTPDLETVLLVWCQSWRPEIIYGKGSRSGAAGSGSWFTVLGKAPEGSRMPFSPVSRIQESCHHVTHSDAFHLNSHSLPMES